MDINTLNLIAHIGVFAYLISGLFFMGYYHKELWHMMGKLRSMHLLPVRLFMVVLGHIFFLLTWVLWLDDLKMWRVVISIKDELETDMVTRTEAGKADKADFIHAFTCTLGGGFVRGLPNPVKFKKLHPDAKAPEAATSGSGGSDLTAVSVSYLEEQGLYHVAFGLAMEIPAGHVGLLFPRSSISKYALILSNGVGVIDSDYRGEVSAKFRPIGNGDIYKPGEKAGQLLIVPVPVVTWEESEELSSTERGTGGFGSTGK